jgi:hypothetical protein
MMNGWHNLHQVDPDAVQTGFRDLPAPMRRGLRIEVDGILLGKVVEHELGVRFVAADPRVTDMDRSIWPNLDYAYRSARQLFRTSRPAHRAET